MQIRHHMHGEARDPNHALNDEYDGAHDQKTPRRGNDQRNEQKAYRQRTGSHGNPLGGREESILCVIGETEDEVADEPTQREQCDPPCPFFIGRVDHPIHDQQEPKPRVREWRGERSAVRQAP